MKKSFKFIFLAVGELVRAEIKLLYSPHATAEI